MCMTPCWSSMYKHGTERVYFQNDIMLTEEVEAAILVEVLLYVHRNRRFIRVGSQDGRLDFHTAPEL